MLLLALLAPWAANAQEPIPYNEGFETMSSADDLTTAGWISHKSSSGSFLAIETNASNVHTGSQALNIDSWDASSTSDWVVVGLPIVNEAINGLQITFSYKVSTGNVSIGYLTDADDASTFVPLQQYNASSSYTTITKELDEAPASAARIAIKYQNWYRCYIDDIEVKALPTCLKPTNLLASNITTNSANLSWTANSGETAWTLYYKKTSETDYTAVTNVTENPYTLPNLTPSSNYQFYVVANCSATDISEGSAVKTFATECEVISAVGYSANFDDYTIASSYTPSSRTLPVCWSYINECTYSSYKNYPTIYYYSSTNYARSTPNSLRFYSCYSSYGSYDPQPQYAILPEMSDLAGKQITLQARGYNTSSTFKIGTMSDPTNTTTFTMIAEQTGLTTSYQEFEYIIPANCTDNYLAIMIDAANSARTYNGVYIDDLSIDNPPTCIKPSGLEQTASTTTTATFDWTNGAEGQTAWQIAYSTDPTFNPDEVTPVDVNEKPGTIDELTASTTYYAYIRANCGAQGYSDWSSVKCQFMTECDAVTTFPWRENFDTRNSGNFSDPCWVNEHVSGTGSYIFSVNTSTQEGNSTRHLRLQDQSAGTETMLRLPEMNLPNANYQFVIDIDRTSNTYQSNPYELEGIYVYVSTDGNLEGATELAYIPRHYQVSSSLIPAEASTGWYTYEIPIGVSGNCYIILKGVNQYVTSIYVDNFAVEQIPTCRKPKNLACDNSLTTAHTATLSWTNGEEGQTAWQIAYSTNTAFAPANDFTPNGTTEWLVDANTNPFTLNGLAQSTTYRAYVRANCGTEGYSDWCVAPISFTTPSGKVTPTGLAVAESTITSSQATASWNAVAGNTLHQSYDIYWATADVTAVPDEPAAPNYISGITATEQLITGLSAETDYKVWVRDNCGADGISAWSSAVPFHTASLCQTPTFSSDAVSNITAHEATITWNDYDQTGFNLRYGTDGENWTVVNNVTNPYTFPNNTLLANTTYQVQVQVTCNTEWSTSTSFRTECDAVTTFPWRENFESYASGNFSDPCWVNEHISGNGSNIFKVSTSALGGNSTHQLQLPDQSSGTMTKLMLPEMNLPNANYQFVLDVYRSNSTYSPSDNPYEGIRIFVSTTGEIEGATQLAFIPRQFDEDGENSITAEASAGWYTYELPIGISENCYIIIRGENRYCSSTYMDNFAVEQIPTCRKPKDLACSETTAHTATLSWINGEEGQTAWQIAYSTNTAFAPANDFTPNGTTEWLVDANTNPFTLNGLAQNTTYRVYVRANCGTNDKSEWCVAPISFTTLAGNVTPTGLAVADNTITSSEATASWNAVAGNTLHESYDIYWATADVTAVPDEPAAPNYISGITTTSQQITGLTEETDYKVWVRDNCGADGRSDWSSAVTFTTAANCQAPDGLEASNVTNNSATISWNAYGQTEFTLRYQVEGAGDEWTKIPGITNDYYTFIPSDNLDEQTTYNVQVMVTSCENDHWSSTLTFTTLCAPITIVQGTAWTEDFETPVVTTTYSQVGEVPGCWDNYPKTSASAKILTVDDQYNYASEGQVLYFYGNGNNYAALPVFSNPLNELQISFKYAFESNSYGTLTLGYITDEDDGTYNTFTQIVNGYTANSQNYHQLKAEKVLLKNVPANATRLVFRWYISSQWGANIDDIAVEVVSSYTKDVLDGKWYAISSPVNTPAVNEVDNLTDGTYDFYRYDEATATWENYKAHTSTFTTFENGRGYIYRNSGDATLKFTGVSNDGSTVTVPFTYTSSLDEHLKGFNLVGNPYTTEATLGKVCYKLNTNGTWAAQLASYAVQPLEGVLVQATSTTDEFAFSISSKSAPKAAQTLALTVSGNGYEDVAYAMLEEGKGLNKVAHLAEDAPALSIPVDGSNYAIAYLGYEVESFPLTLNAQAGEYTIALNNQISGLSYCHLLDKVTGKETDLLKGAYTFKANGNSDRFTVLLNASLENGEIAIWNGNSWIVNGEGTLQVFDVMGRRVYNQEVAGQSSLNTDELATGVYVIRLGEKSQKIVVK